MTELRLNTDYLKTNRGIIKIIEIILGIIIASLLCATELGRYDSRGCYGDSRPGYTGTLNLIMLVCNIVFFIFNFINFTIYKVVSTYILVEK
jgi:hypothetical protein